MSRLFFIHRNGRQFGRQNEIFGLFLFLGLIHQLAAGIDQPRSDEDYKVTLQMLLGVRPEKPAYDRDVTKDRSPIFGFLHVLTHQSAEHDRSEMVFRALRCRRAKKDFLGVTQP